MIMYLGTYYVVEGQRRKGEAAEGVAENRDKPQRTSMTR